MGYLTPRSQRGEASAVLRISAFAYSKACRAAATGVWPTESNGGVLLIKKLQLAEKKLHEAAIDWEKYHEKS